MSRHTKSRQSSKFFRWRDRLSGFDYEIQYKPGKTNLVADALSRLAKVSATTTNIDDNPRVNVKSVLSSQEGITSHEFQSAVEKDTVLQTVRQFVKGKWPNAKSIRQDIKPYFRVRHCLHVTSDDFLVLNEKRIVVPAQMRDKLLRLAHDGHPGIVRMKRKLRQSYWWPGMSSESERFVTGCEGCLFSAKSQSRIKPTETKPAITAKRPMEQISIDIQGPFANAPRHERFLVVLTDNFSRYPWVLATGDICSNRIMEWIDEVFSQFGYPDSLLSDNGPQLTSVVFQEYLKLNDIFQKLSPNYCPRTNGKLKFSTDISNMGSRP
jgi:hypothetical protein